MRRAMALRAVARDHRLRKLVVAFGCFTVTEFGTWLAVGVYAFERGGVREVGFAGFAQLLPAACIAPIAAYAGDRFRRDRVLAGGLGAVGIFAIATGIAMLLDAPAFVVYPLGAAAASSMTIARPAMGSILPAVSETPSSLTAANAVVGLIEGFGQFAGPALAGVLLISGEPGTVFTVLGGASLMGAMLVVSVGFEPARMRPTGDMSASTLGVELRSGFGTIAEDTAVAGSIALMAAGFVITGALDVLFVAVAFELLDAGDGVAGVLSSAAGLGGIIGAGAAIALVSVTRLRPTLAGATVVTGAAMAVLARPGMTIVAAIAVAVAAGGITFSLVAGRTLIQRTTSDDVLARVLGVLEGTSQLGLALGSLTVGAVTGGFGLEAAVLVIAALLPAVVVVCWRALGRADRAAATIDPEAVQLVLGVDLFATLDAPAISQIAANLHPVRARAGDDLIRAGDDGDRFYIIAEGCFDIHNQGRLLATRGPGDYVGEIALLFDVARTATVTATEPSRLFGLGRSVFLEAVTGHPVAAAMAHRVASERRANS